MLKNCQERGEREREGKKEAYRAQASGKKRYKTNCNKTVKRRGRKYITKITPNLKNIKHPTSKPELPSTQKLGTFQAQMS